MNCWTRLNLATRRQRAAEDFLAPLGELTLDLGGGVEDLSDFGLLTNWNAGLNWRPSDSLSLQASYGMREQAPGIAQLGNPQIVDVNQPVYDFATGETVLANVVTRGNPNLLAETQRDIKLAASYDFDLFDLVEFRVEYVRNRSDDVTESFPLLTPAIEAAFPDRVTRENGQLVELDRRAVTFAERGSSRIRYFNFFGRVGSESEGGSRGGRGGMMARIASAARGSSSQGEGQGQGQTGGVRSRTFPAGARTVLLIRRSARISRAAAGADAAAPARREWRGRPGACGRGARAHSQRRGCTEP